MKSGQLSPKQVLLANVLYITPTRKGKGKRKKVVKRCDRISPSTKVKMVY